MASNSIKKPDIKVNYSSPTSIGVTSGTEITRTSILSGWVSSYNSTQWSFYVNNALVSYVVNAAQGYALQIPVCLVLSKGDTLKIVKTGTNGDINCKLYPIDLI